MMVSVTPVTDFLGQNNMIWHVAVHMPFSFLVKIIFMVRQGRENLLSDVKT